MLDRLTALLRGCPARRYDLPGRTVLITGGNSGIGEATATALARDGARVLITARDRERGSQAVERIHRASGSEAIELVDLDLASLGSVRRCAETVRQRVDHLDVLINNAGLTSSERTTTEDGFETLFQVNHLGHFLLTDLLLDLLRSSAPARIVVVASAAHRQATIDLDDLQSEHGPFLGLLAYARTKLANVLFARELARRLEGTGVTVNAVHPGTVRSGFGMGGDAGGLLRLGMHLGRPFFLSPARAARRVTYVAAAPELAGETGGYYSRCRRVAPSSAAQDDALAGALWDRSAELVGAA